MWLRLIGVEHFNRRTLLAIGRQGYLSVIDEVVLHVVIRDDRAFHMVGIAVTGDGKFLVVSIFVVPGVGGQLHVGIVAHVEVIGGVRAGQVTLLSGIEVEPNGGVNRCGLQHQPVAVGTRRGESGVVGVVQRLSLHRRETYGIHHLALHAARVGTEIDGDAETAELVRAVDGNRRAINIGDGQDRVTKGVFVFIGDIINLSAVSRGVKVLLHPAVDGYSADGIRCANGHGAIGEAGEIGAIQVVPFMSCGISRAIGYRDGNTLQGKSISRLVDNGIGCRDDHRRLGIAPYVLGCSLCRVAPNGNNDEKHQ